MKIIKSIFPIYFWFFLTIGFVCLFGINTRVFGYILLNLVATLFFIKLGVVLHEIGHLLFGKLAGGNPKRIVLGKSHEITRFDFCNIKIILNKDFNGGFAFVNFPQGKNSKFSQFILTAGGVITNFIFAYIFYLIFGFSISFMSGRDGLDLASAFISANILLALTNLIPFRVDYLGVKIPNDGLTLLKIPFRKKNETNIDFNDFFEAHEKFEIKEFDEAIELYSRYIDIKETELLARYNIGLMLTKKGKIDEALNWTKPCLDIVDKEKNKMMYAHINNGLAWFKLVKGDKDDIDILSKTAYSIKSDFSYFIGTRGSVLIELGKIEVGIKMLKPLVDFNFPNNQTLSAAIYLYYGMNLLKENKKAQKYSDFIIKNIDKLDADDLLLWNRIQEKSK
ncbi:hypothetical protein H8K90_16320 [Winogradskyella echinorum]|uniref:Peptidase M50 domain-containing protein n=1 Tax=Winogradskyella echinorum TaxID=538189 RepID=A0ABR6Y5E4_9FLAO|nr:site-2 protease family protein [Winogradskyella echinorum]MBC3847962.1 hypothetical protein [Winogradskyella echinorum]MBC5752310.1 hypothetical protein [Winogradskyella echinorum]